MSTLKKIFITIIFLSVISLTPILKIKALPKCERKETNSALDKALIFKIGVKEITLKKIIVMNIFFNVDI